MAPDILERYLSEGVALEDDALDVTVNAALAEPPQTLG